MTEPGRGSTLPSEIPVDTQGGLRVRADYFSGRIDLKAFRTRFPHYPVLASDPLVIEPESGAYAVLTKFGGLVCWNASAQLVQQLWKEVESLPETGKRIDEVQDSVEVYTGQPKDLVEFERIAVRKLTKEKLKVISMSLAQSVALEHFENRVREALSQSEPFVIRLRDKGNLRRKEREIVQAVGFALEIRSAVLANLTLFDSPPEAWESATIARLVGKLYDLFDLDERLDAIKEKVEYLTDLNSTLLTLLSNRKSRHLEWVIIILIFLEIVFFVWLEVFGR